MHPDEEACIICQVQCVIRWNKTSPTGNLSLLGRRKAKLFSSWHPLFRRKVKPKEEHFLTHETSDLVPLQGFHSVTSRSHLDQLPFLLTKCTESLGGYSSRTTDKVTSRTRAGLSKITPVSGLICFIQQFVTERCLIYSTRGLRYTYIIRLPDLLPDFFHARIVSRKRSDATGD